MTSVRNNLMALVGLAALFVLVLTGHLEAEAVVTYIVGLGISAPAIEAVKTTIASRNAEV
jgi:hypothetical protein